MQVNSLSSEAEFYVRYRGSFTGILRWPQLDELWQSLRSRSNEVWYVYAIGEDVPQQPVSSMQFNTFIDEIDLLLRKEHQEDYCGVVYVDDRNRPTFIKIYDPHNLGVVCGYSNNPPLPGWIISQLSPARLEQNTFSSQARKRWWQRLFHSN